MDSKISKKTQDTLGKIIKKPPLTDKLLGKPPFRFLHDIITEVIRTSGFLKGLFPPEQMESKNVTSRDDKISFLQKVISCVSLVTGDSLSARPSKIVAGQEPEKTNELLQALARCIRKNMSSDEAVSQILSGNVGKPAKTKDKPPSGTSKKLDGEEKKEREGEKHKRRDKHDSSREKSADKRRRERSSDRERSREKSVSRERRENSATKRDESGSKEGVNDDRDGKERRRHKRKERHERKDKTNKDVETSSIASPSSATSPLITSDKPGEVSPAHVQVDAGDNSQPGQREATEGAESNTPTSMARTQRPASAKGQRRRPNAGSARSNHASDEVSESPSNDPPQAPRKLIRPPSARPSAPRVKQRPAESDETERIDSAGQERSVPIFVDHDIDESLSDEDNQFVVAEEGLPENNNQVINGSHQVDDNIGNDDDDEDEHGGLVRKILETKKELEETAAAGHGIKKHTDIQRSSVITAQQKKERELVVKEIEQLRMSVQKLCQSTTPLAKIIDYIQEDMDSMQNELQAWKKENKLHAIRIKEEDSITAECIEPLKTELEGLDQNIAQYRNQMSATKANIIRNEEKIQKMIVAVAARS